MHTRHLSELCRSSSLLFTLLLLCFGAAPLYSQSPSRSSASDFGQAKLEQALRWRLIGPFRAGRVTSIVGIAQDPTVYYMATPGGGVWKTTDSGRVWKPIFDSVPIASIGAVALAPSRPETVFVGTGEQTAGDGVYKSIDAGQTWTNVGLKGTHVISSVIVDPKNPDIVVVAAAGDTQSGKERGIYKTDDGGKSWKHTLTVSGDDESGAYDLNQAPDAANVMYATFWHRSVRGIVSGGNDDTAKKQDAHIFISNDEGSTWHEVQNAGLPAEPWGRVGVAAAPAHNGKLVYAIMTQGLFRSDDAGAHWRKATADTRVIGNGYFSRVFISPENANEIYVAQTSMYRSTDGGVTFTSWFGAPSGDDIHTMWINPADPRHMILGVDQGAVVSVDHGATWTSWYNQPTGQFYHVSTDNRFPYTVYGAQQDSGTAGIRSRSDFGEITARDWAPVGGFEFSFIAPDPLNNNLIYTGGWYGSVIRFDRSTSQIMPVFVRSQKYRTAGMAPIAFSPQDPHLLVVGSQFVMMSRDGGASWQEASPDLTQKPEEAAKGKKATPGDATRSRDTFLNTLSLSRVKQGEIWAGTSNGLVHVTVNGKTWQNVTPPGLPERASIRMIESSAHDAATAYAVVGSRDFHRPLIARTQDYGRTWQTIVSGLKEDRPARVVREDPEIKGLLYAGTDDAIYFSTDNGDHWQILQLNLPTTPISDLDVHGSDLVAATYGRSLWILDDLTPLRKLDNAIAQSPAFLFAPSSAIRARWDMNQDTPLPPETPAGKNPPDGAILDYFLHEPASDLKLLIYNSSGQLVRTVSTTPEPFDTAAANAPEYWFTDPAALPNRAGLNRFVWDLRYAAPKTLRYSYFDNPTEYIEYTMADHAIPGETPRQQPMGALVLPGKYTLALTASGKTYQQILEVAPDPRVHVPQEDLAEQLRIERIASDSMAASYEAFAQVKSLLDALQKVQKSSGASANTNPGLTDLQKKADQIANHEHSDLGIGPVNRELARLFEVISSGDGRPAAPLGESVQQYCRDLGKRLAEWRELNANTAPRLGSSLPVAGSVPADPACN